MSKEEEIFESAGEVVDLSILPTAAVEEVQSEDIDLTSWDASEAFAAFNGKVFLGATSSSSTERIYSAADGNEALAESPIQRYTRLKAELGELMRDVDLMREETKAKDEGATLWAVLQRETKKTIDSLRTLDGDVLDSSGGGVDSGLAGLLDKLELRAPGVEGAVTGSDRVTATSSGPRSSSVSELEKRLFAMESMLGLTSNLLDMESVGDGYEEARGGIFPLVDTVARLERRVDTLDERTLESIRSKAAAVQTELEAMNREKGRGASSAEQKAIDAAAVVEDLVKRAKRADAVAKEVPPLLVRLKTLENTHAAASTFVQRLELLETAVGQASESVAENDEILKTLRESITSSISIFKGNIDRVDARIAKLS